MREFLGRGFRIFPGVDVDPVRSRESDDVSGVVEPLEPCSALLVAPAEVQAVDLCHFAWDSEVPKDPFVPGRHLEGRLSSVLAGHRGCLALGGGRWLPSEIVEGFEDGVPGPGVLVVVDEGEDLLAVVGVGDGPAGTRDALRERLVMRVDERHAAQGRAEETLADPGGGILDSREGGGELVEEGWEDAGPDLDEKLEDFVLLLLAEVADELQDSGVLATRSGGSLYIVGRGESDEQRGWDAEEVSVAVLGDESCAFGLDEADRFLSPVVAADDDQGSFGEVPEAVCGRACVLVPLPSSGTIVACELGEDLLDAAVRIRVRSPCRRPCGRRELGAIRGSRRTCPTSRRASGWGRGVGGHIPQLC